MAKYLYCLWKSALELEPANAVAKPFKFLQQQQQQ
jgi:hypothetical protein